MSFDDYFDLHSDQEPLDQLVNFLAGLAPKALHAPYMDLSSVDTASGRGPSSIIATQLAGSLAAAEAVRILLGRGPSRLAPIIFRSTRIATACVKVTFGRGTGPGRSRLIAGY